VSDEILYIKVEFAKIVAPSPKKETKSTEFFNLKAVKYAGELLSFSLE
jgi:hypothetical protein